MHRLWRAEGLKVPQKRRKRRANGNRRHACHKLRAEHINHVWAWDFIFDHTINGGTIKCLTIVDEYTRECITLDISRSITAEDVIDRLAELFVMYGVPKCIRSDNGPEFVANAIQGWLSSMNVATLYIEPGSPWQNGYEFLVHFRELFPHVDSLTGIVLHVVKASVEPEPEALTSYTGLSFEVIDVKPVWPVFGILEKQRFQTDSVHR